MPSLADTLRPSSDKQTNALRSRLDGLGAEGADAIQQIREINGSFPGWRWIEEVVEGDDEGDEDEDTSTRYVHIWVKLAPGVEAKDVVFRAKKGATNVVGLTVGGEVVFDDSMRLNSDVDGHDSEWTIEADDRRGGCRSVHITLTRCKAVKYYDWGRPFRNLKDLEAKKAPLLRKAAFGDGVSVAPAPAPAAKKKKKRAVKKEVILEEGEDFRPEVFAPPPKPKPRVGDWYGVPVSDAGGAWSIVTGRAAAKTESHLVARPRKAAAAAATEAASSAAAPSRAAAAVGDATCAAVEEARAAARDAPPEDDEEDEAIGKALFPARVFDPLFSLGITFDEDTLEVLGVARDGQGFQTGVLVGWRAVYVGETRAPLGSLQQLINELTAARQEQRRLAVVFEGDARE